MRGVVGIKLIYMDIGDIKVGVWCHGAYHGPKKCLTATEYLIHDMFVIEHLGGGGYFIKFWVPTFSMR